MYNSWGTRTAAVLFAGANGDATATQHCISPPASLCKSAWASCSTGHLLLQVSVSRTDVPAGKANMRAPFRTAGTALVEESMFLWSFVLQKMEGDLCCQCGRRNHYRIIEWFG